MDRRAKDRALAQRTADVLWSRYARLPAATSSYALTRDLRIPMRDGVELLADVYEPDRSASGTILVSSPYGWNLVGAAMTGGVFACRGYRVVLVRCRGTFGSGGTFEPFIGRSTTRPTSSRGCVGSRGSTGVSPPTATRTAGSRSGRC